MQNSKTGFTEKFAGHRWNKPVVWDVLFVLVLPIACLILDPGILRMSFLGRGLLTGFQIPAYFLIALLVAVFWTSYLQVLPPFAVGFVRGGLILGVLLSGLFALFLVPLGLSMSIVALGAGDLPDAALMSFGVVPAFTAHRYFRRFRVLRERVIRQKAREGALPLGFLAPAALALVLNFGAGKILDISFRELRSGDPEVALADVERLADHPLCLSDCWRRLCRSTRDLPPEDVQRFFQGNPGNCPSD